MSNNNTVLNVAKDTARDIVGLSPDGTWSPLNPAVYNAGVTFGVAKALEDSFVKTFNNSLDKTFKEMQGRYGNAITDEQYAKVKNMKDDFMDVIREKVKEVSRAEQAQHLDERVRDVQNVAKSAFDKAKQYQQQADAWWNKAQSFNDPEQKTQWEQKSQEARAKADAYNQKGSRYMSDIDHYKNVASEYRQQAATARHQYFQAYNNFAKNADVAQARADKFANLGQVVNLAGVLFAGDFHRVLYAGDSENPLAFDLDGALDVDATPYAKAAASTLAGVAASMIIGMTLTALSFPALAVAVTSLTIGILATSGANTLWDKLGLSEYYGGLSLREAFGRWSDLDFQDWLFGSFDAWLGLDRQGNYYIYDPLILDLDGDGIETVGVDFKTASNNAYFDFDNDGLLNATGWVKSDDGLLVRDLNNNGVIDNGSEIFGDRTLKQNGELATHGFDALQDLDDNKDGIINHQDTAFNTLKIWQDYNKDGISQADELKSLSDLNIQSLTTQYQNTNETTNGGQLVQLGNFTKTDGTTHKMGDVNFNFSPVFSRYAEKIKVDARTRGLPNLGGIGRVRSLHEALSGGHAGLVMRVELKEDENTVERPSTTSSIRSADSEMSLYEVLTAYKYTNSHQAQMDLLPKLLKAWAMTDAEYEEYTGTIGDASLMIVSSGNGGVGLTPNQVTIMEADPERFAAIQRFEKHKHKIGVLDSLFGTKTRRFSAMTTEQINQVTDTIIASYDALIEQAYIALYPQTENYQGLLSKLDIAINIDETGNLTQSIDFSRLAEYAKQSNSFGNESGFVRMMEFLSFFSKHRNHSMQISGLDKLNATAADGIHNISDSALISWQESIHSTLKNNDFVSFAIGSERRDASILIGNGGNNNLYANGVGNAVLSGGNGADTLVGNDGDDRLNGGNDDDRLNGGNGQDTLIGGTGNDHLDGGEGADTYVFAKGHGQDVISETDYNSDKHSNQDVVKFTDVRSDEIQIQLQGNDLIITGYNGDDKVTIKNFNYYYAHQMEVFEFSDKTLTLDELMNQYTATYLASDNDDHQGIGAWVGKLTTNLAVGDDNFDASPLQDTAVVDGGDGNDTIRTGSGNDRLNGGNGADTLVGNDGDDRLNGGNDDDRLFGGNGVDTLIGGTGNDHLDGGEGADTYVFAKGHGQDVISETDYNSDKHSNQDVVKFTDVRSDEIQIQLQGNDLIITGYNGDDKVTIKNFNYYYAHQMEVFEFSDKTLTLDELMNQYTATYLASDNDDHQGIGAWVGKLTTNLAVGDDNFDASPLQDTAVVDGGDGNDTIRTGSGNDRLNGGNGADTLVGNDGDDRLNGGNDDDRLFGGNGVDTLIGGTGNDHLDGGEGADTYVFAKGHGQDVISETDYNSDKHSNQDVVKFTDVRSDEIQIQLQGNDLIITGYNGDDKVTIKNFNYYYAHQMEVFEFSDKTLTLDELMNQYTATYLASDNDDHQGIGAWVGKLTTNLAVGDDNFDASPLQDTAVVDGGDGNDTIRTGSGNDRLNGGNGADTLVGNDGDDRLNGGNDDDRLFGGNGVDTLIGGTGNDHLDGGEGADTYVFAKGHGQDVISETDYNSDKHSNQDVVKFTDVRSDEIQIQLQGNDLIITGYNGDDKVTIKNFNYYYAHQMEVFEFSDKTLTLDELMNQYTATYLASDNDDHQGIGAWVGKLTTNLAVGDDNFDASPLQDTAVVDGGDGNDTIRTGSGNDRLNGGNGADTLVGNDGDDRLNGGNDDDRLFGGNGVDTLIGGTGNDHLDGGEGADTYVFAKGHGQDVISETDYNSDKHSNQDVVKFTDVRSDEIQIQLQGNDLIITGYNGDDKVTIKNFNYYYAHQMEVFEFSDKTLTLDELMNQYTATYLASDNDDHQGIGAWVGKLTTNLAVGDDNFDASPLQDTAVVDGGDGNDTIRTGSGNDRLNGGNGADTLVGNDGDDRLNGGNDDDRLFGGNGVDTLIGGTGNDHLDGGEGADTYVFAKGHGQDVISETDYNSDKHSNQDVVKFTDVRSDEIQIQLQGNDLIITGYNGDDKVTIKDFNSSYSYQMEVFEFSDGVLSVEELLALKDRNKNGLTGSTERSTASADSNMQASAIMQATHALIQAISINTTNYDSAGYGNFDMQNNLSNDMLWKVIAVSH